MPSEMCGDGFEWYLVGFELKEFKIKLLPCFARFIKS